MLKSILQVQYQKRMSGEEACGVSGTRFKDASRNIRQRAPSPHTPTWFRQV